MRNRGFRASFDGQRGQAPTSLSCHDRRRVDHVDAAVGFSLMFEADFEKWQPLTDGYVGLLWTVEQLWIPESDS